MKFFFTLLLLPLSALAFFQQPTQSLSLLQAGYAGAANYADGQNSIVVGKTDTSSGDYVAQPVAPADFFKGLVFGVDSNSFAVLNGTLYSKAVAGGGSYPAIVTNYDATAFAATNFIYLGNVPSFYGWTHSGYTNATIDIGMAAGAQVVASADGGTTWTQNPTNVPCVIALTNNVGATDNATNVTVLAYVNPAAIGATNDRTDQVEFVAPAVDPKSPVTLSQMQAGDATAAANWATFPASSDVDLSGRGLKFGGTWKVWTSNGVMIATANLVDVWTVTPGISTNGNAPTLVSLTVGSYYTFKVSADSSPTIYYSTNLPNTNSWPVLPSQTNSFSAGYWFVTAPLLTNAAAYFRAAIAGTNGTAAVLNFNGNVKAQTFTGNLDITNVIGLGGLAKSNRLAYALLDGVPTIPPATTNFDKSSITNADWLNSISNLNAAKMTGALPQYPTVQVTANTPSANYIMGWDGSTNRVSTNVIPSGVTMPATQLTGTVPSGNLPGAVHLCSATPQDAYTQSGNSVYYYAPMGASVGGTTENRWRNFLPIAAPFTITNIGIVFNQISAIALGGGTNLVLSFIVNGGQVGGSTTLVGTGNYNTCKVVDTTNSIYVTAGGLTNLFSWAISNTAAVSTPSMAPIITFQIVK